MRKLPPGADGGEVEGVKVHQGERKIAGLVDLGHSQHDGFRPQIEPGEGGHRVVIGRRHRVLRRVGTAPVDERIERTLVFGRRLIHRVEKQRAVILHQRISKNIRLPGQGAHFVGRQRALRRTGRGRNGQKKTSDHGEMGKAFHQQVAGGCYRSRGRRMEALMTAAAGESTSPPETKASVQRVAWIA